MRFGRCLLYEVEYSAEIYLARMGMRVYDSPRRCEEKLK